MDGGILALGKAVVLSSLLDVSAGIDVICRQLAMSFSVEVPAVMVLVLLVLVVSLPSEVENITSRMTSGWCFMRLGTSLFDNSHQRARSVWPILSTLSLFECVISISPTSYSPVSVRIPQQLDGGIAVSDMTDSREDLLNVIPENDCLTTNVITGDLFDSDLPC
jgi:hypothetical protein